MPQRPPFILNQHDPEPLAGEANAPASSREDSRMFSRAAVPDDAALLVTLARACFRETFGHLYAPSDLEQFLAGHEPVRWRAELADPRFSVRVVFQAAPGSDDDDADDLGRGRGEAIAYCMVGPLSLPLGTGDAKPVAFEGDERTSFAGGRRALELRMLYVLKPWHGTGVAASLMTWALDDARARGAEDVYLSVWSENHRAHRFYARYGFVEVGAYKFMVGSHADDERIWKLSFDDGPAWRREAESE